ncbi:MAG TPA: thioredoxin domain-containing protein [Acidimicrobiia bacterium]|nr:thioredoxin domain-containing protein [Acidimicrobiia bacterium]
MANRLAGETSPYLRQHADNPVDWYPWGEEAFARARAEDRPILLSVGYSSCHWCHVMAHESFEDAEVAAAMNAAFVNVKVDREERPDVDSIYMQAVQAMTGHGGWPMTVFLAPDGRPFFGGTYFPKDDRPGMTGFLRLIEAVDRAWREQRAELLEQADKLRDAIGRMLDAGSGAGSGGTRPTPAVLERALANVRTQFDPRFGGFGRAPKFPQAMTLDFLLRTYIRDPDPSTLEMVTVSLDAMAAGGMHDQLGGGFHRYSVDDYWLVPHFEKMLYDQALLAGAYLRGWLVTREPRYRRVLEGVVEYVLRDLTHPLGGFFSAEDADSEGVEGKFYCWQLEEIENVCGDDAPEVVRYYGVTRNGNFVDPHTDFRGNILHVVDRTEEPSEAVRRGARALLGARELRVRPGLDDKVLLAWNALFTRTLAEAATALDRDDWMRAAVRNAHFLLGNLRRDDGRLLRSWQGGRANPDLLAYAEDHAALLEALLTLAEVDDLAWLAEARTVAGALLDLFADREHGGFFTTGADAEALIVRPKDTQDNATPAENSLAANGLLRLAALTGDTSYADAAARCVENLTPVMGEHPTAFAYLLGALERLVSPPIEIAVVGDPTAPATRALRAEVVTRLIPASVSVTAGPGTPAISPLLEGRIAGDGTAIAYVCERYACRAPVTSPDALRGDIDAALAARRQ